MNVRRDTKQSEINILSCSVGLDKNTHLGVGINFLFVSPF